MAKTARTPEEIAADKIQRERLVAAGLAALMPSMSAWYELRDYPAQAAKAFAEALTEKLRAVHVSVKEDAIIAAAPALFVSTDYNHSADWAAKYLGYKSPECLITSADAKRLRDSFLTAARSRAAVYRRQRSNRIKTALTLPVLTMLRLAALVDRYEAADVRDCGPLFAQKTTMQDAIAHLISAEYDRLGLTELLTAEDLEANRKVRLRAKREAAAAAKTAEAAA